MNGQGERSRQFNRTIVVASLVGAIAVVALVAGLWLFPATTGAAVAQPIQFNHAAHVKLMTCVFCHQYYPTRDVAGRPALVRCMLCHAYPVTDKPEAAKLQKFAQERREIPWVRLTRVPDYVHFSHRRHVVAGKVDCERCHGEMAQRTTPPAAPLLPIRMQLCLNCHRSKAVELSPRSLAALRADSLTPAVQQALDDLEYKRFPSSAELIGALATAAGGQVPAADRKRILSQVQDAPRLTTDCIGCHR